MTGFKSGASDDNPLAETDQQEQSEQPDQETEHDHETEDQTHQDTTETPHESADTARSPDRPWVLTRDAITDGRAKTVQLHLQQETLELERRVKEQQLGIDETVQKADLREAAYQVGLAHVDELTDTLQDWGYDYWE